MDADLVVELLIDVVQGGEQLVSGREIRKIYRREMPLVVHRRYRKACGSDPEGQFSLLLRIAEVLHRKEGDGEEGQQDEVLEEALQMGQMDGFSETAAVHLRVLDKQGQGHAREQQGQDTAEDPGQFPENARDEGRSEQGFQQGEGDAGRLGCPFQELQSEELVIGRYDQPRPDGIQQLQQAGNQENESAEDCGETSELIHGPVLLSEGRRPYGYG